MYKKILVHNVRKPVGDISVLRPNTIERGTECVGGPRDNRPGAISFKETTRGIQFPFLPYLTWCGADVRVCVTLTGGLCVCVCVPL